MFVKPHPERTVLLGHAPATPEALGDEISLPVAVLHPHTRQPIPRAGMDVPEDAYWMRRLRDGDIVLAERPAPVSEVAAERAEAPALPAPASEEPAQAEEHVQ